MKKSVNPKKYSKNVNLSTGEISKHLDKNDSSNDTSDSNYDYHQDVIKILPCPYQFDNPDLYKKLTKPFKKLKFSYEVEVEASLSASSLEEHQHEIVLEPVWKLRSSAGNIIFIAKDSLILVEFGRNQIL